MSTKTKWFKGPPPSVGWWPASRVRLIGTFRWWNGHNWSQPAYSSNTRAYAASRATMFVVPEGIEWTHRPDDWPKRSKT